MNFLITALAVFGLAALITSYDGPGSIFARLRNKYPNSPFHCTLCTATWLIIPIMLLAFFAGMVFVVPFAILGTIIIIERLT